MCFSKTDLVRLKLTSLQLNSGRCGRAVMDRYDSPWVQVGLWAPLLKVAVNTALPTKTVPSQMDVYQKPVCSYSVHASVPRCSFTTAQQSSCQYGIFHKLVDGKLGTLQTI